MHAPTYEQIAQRAHQLWLDQGCPEGRSDEHWIEAERSLQNSLASGDQSHVPTVGADGPATLVAANNPHHPVAKPNLQAIAAAESAEENLMSPAPSDDAAINAALPADTTRSRQPSEPQPKSATTAAPPKSPGSSAAGKSKSPLVEGR